MMMLLVLKERLKSFYGKYAMLVDGAVKFLYAFVALYLLNENYSGYNISFGNIGCIFFRAGTAVCRCTYKGFPSWKDTLCRGYKFCAHRERIHNIAPSKQLYTETDIPGFP